VSRPLCIGLDVGGSKTELLASRSRDDERIRLTGPGANIQRIGIEASARTLADLIQRALRQYAAPQLASVCAGIAGAGRASDQDALAQHLLTLLDLSPAPHVQIVHDAQIALEAAFNEGSGMIVIVGTGSVVFARTQDGTLMRTGGWGYLLGDEGSGFALGQSGLRAVAHAIDGGPPTMLQQQVADQYGLDTRDQLIHQVYQHDWPMQDVAPLVIEAALDGDAVARQIVDDQTDQLTCQVEWLIGRCDETEPRIALMGGLIRETHYAKVLQRTLTERLPNWSVQTLDQRPVVGALRLATRMPA
jgi:N-acetylglucosamine kinase-like BadF-type ATPase